ncbi:MAG TPA: 1-deoxy-D-xylulose-5-phosphate reductoisomerase [Acidiferrobacterales bacterium]|nr:1-deoxy-D-xylulose-5-phosphate reductoisomerase [Acidiferrobacterales bacterium]
MRLNSAGVLPEARLKGVTILGATGSIGVSTLDVLARHPQRYRVVALTANTQAEGLFEQCQRFHPEVAVLRDPAAATRLEDMIRRAGLRIQVLAGAEALETVARDPGSDIVMAAIVGAAGLLPVLEAVRAGKRVLLANKEPLVMSGPVLMQEARRSGAEILPIDSEHNAIFQCMPAGYRTGDKPAGVRRILLTCSGGPFRATPAEALRNVTPDEACAHPRWAMGRKISVDSATLMNKGLELIEACRLFDVTPDQVQIVIHPQSVIHSMVEYTDGSVLAQLGNPDMRTPIAHALAWPERIESGVRQLDLFEIARLDFAPPDLKRFPCLRLAQAAAQAGGTAPAILNAANEVAVNAFLEGHIRFTQIAEVIEYTLAVVQESDEATLESILASDQCARNAAGQYIAAHASQPKRGQP